MSGGRFLVWDESVEEQEDGMMLAAQDATHAAEKYVSKLIGNGDLSPDETPVIVQVAAEAGDSPIVTVKIVIDWEPSLYSTIVSTAPQGEPPVTPPAKFTGEF